MTIHHYPETEFEGNADYVLGTAVVEADWANDFSADIGGVDGPTVRCELVRFQVGELTLDRSQIAELAGDGAVRDFEERCEETLSQEQAA